MTVQNEFPAAAGYRAFPLVDVRNVERAAAARAFPLIPRKRMQHG